MNAALPEAPAPQSESLANNILHVYGQGAWHDDAYLMGTRPALLRLRDAIDRALASEVGSFTAMVADGEGFNAHVILNDKPWDDWRSVAEPYTEEMAAERREDAVWPHKIIAVRGDLNPENASESPATTPMTAIRTEG